MTWIEKMNEGGALRTAIIVACLVCRLDAFACPKQTFLFRRIALRKIWSRSPLAYEDPKVGQMAPKNQLILAKLILGEFVPCESFIRIALRKF